MPRGSRNGRRRRSRQSGPGERHVGSQERSPKEQMLSEMRSHYSTQLQTQWSLKQLKEDTALYAYKLQKP